MKLLYIVQHSVSTPDGKWSSADSNINMFAGIMREITKQRPSWKIDVLIGDAFSDIDDPREIFEHPNVRYLQHPFPVNPTLLRYTFDFDEHLIGSNYHVIWNNIPELSRNIMSWLKALKHPAKLVTCNYWMDCPFIGEPKVADDVSYVFRQIDGALSSDLVPFTCESTREAFLDNTAAVNLQHEFLNKRTDTIWDFGYSATELDQYEVPRRFDVKTIVFPNRLTSLNYTHHEEFIEAVNLLYTTRQDFRVVFTNPSQKVSWDELERRVDPLWVYSRENLTRQQYAELLWQSHVAVSLFTLERYGGCANVEAIHCGCLPVMPRTHEYAKRVEKHYPGFLSAFTNESVDVTELCETLNTVLNNYHPLVSNYQSVNTWRVYARSSFEAVSGRVIADLEALL